MSKSSKELQSVIIHELGHVLTWYLINGNNGIETIVIEGNTEMLSGHAVMFGHYPIQVLFGGVVAESICGYTKSKMHRGTDAERIKTLVPDKGERERIRNNVETMLTPFREKLMEMKDECLNNNPVENELNFYIRIFKDELISMLERVSK